MSRRHKQDGLANHLVEEAHNARADTSFNQHPRQHSPAPVSLDEIVKHRRPIIVVAGHGAAKTAAGVDAFQRDTIGIDGNVRGSMELGLNLAVLQKLSASLAQLGVRVAAIQGAAGDMQVAIGAVGERHTALLVNANSVLGVMTSRVKVHPTRGSGSARAARHRATFMVDLVFAPSSWDGRTVSGWRVVGAWGWQGSGTNIVESIAMGRKGGQSNISFTLGAVNSAALTFLVAFIFTGHVTLVGCVRHVVGSDSRQANHELHLGGVGLEAFAFK